MENFFKKAIGLFVEIEAPDSNKEFTATDNSVGQAETESVRLPSNAKFEKHFMDLFARANQPGPDYFDFLKMMDTLAPHLPDVKARSAAALATLKIQGMTREKLVQSAHFYEQLLHTDAVQFETAVEEKLKEEVTSRQNHIELLTRQNELNEEKIKTLRQQIEDNQASINETQNQLAEEEKRLVENKTVYARASNRLLNQLKNDLETIQSNL